ncbi:MAG: DnaJ domain-containing protein [Flavobacteriales bacterium]|nr:DnaJ domain-containing protein [Flavobacteriales bacterium]
MSKGASWSDLLDRAIQVAIDKLIKKGNFSYSTKTQGAKFDKYAQAKTKSDLKSQFASNLLVITAAVMKADGKVMKSELEYVKGFFYRQFPKDFASVRIKMLKEILTLDYPVDKAAKLILDCMPLNQRKYLLEYLFNVAKADGAIVKEEVKIIDLVASIIGFSGAGYENLKAKYLKIASSDEYAILGIKRDASVAEIKKAYRKLANQYHPDKLIDASEEEKDKAKKEFQRLQNAYEKIMKSKNQNL